MRLVGLGPWPANPKYCRGCYRALYRQRAGAEIPCTLLFADVRGSTGMAEAMAPADYRNVMEGFYATAFGILVEHDAFVDKFVGDEVIGIFVPAMTDDQHARAALTAGLALLRATDDVAGQQSLPVGVGVNTGVAYVGAVGTDQHVEFTALGDPVNVAARLASAAGGGEMLATIDTMRAASWPDGTLERRRLDVRGKTDPVDVVVLRPDDRGG
jgi:adenylate cyclase